MKHKLYSLLVMSALAGAPATSMAQSTGAGLAGSDCKEMYQVQKKDNLYAIAMNHGITVEELLAANPEIDPGKKLKKGAFLCIPFSKAEIAAEQARLEQERRAREAREAELAARKAAEEEQARRMQPHPKSHVRAAVLLPFKDAKKSARMLDFYRGVLLAGDSIQRVGTAQMEIFAYHSGSTAADMDSLLKAKPELSNVDVIFGPLEQSQVAALNAHCKARNIEMVMPFATTDDAGLNNPHAFAVTDESADVQKRAVALMLKQFPDANYVTVTATADDRGQQLTATLKTAVKATQRHEVKATFTDAELMAALDMGRVNVLVLNTAKQAALSALENRLDQFVAAHPGYRFALLGYPDWLTYTGGTLHKMHTYDAYVYSTFYRDVNNPGVPSMEKRYTAMFKGKILNSTPRYGLLGFDLGFYFLDGVAHYGDNFINLQGQLQYAPLQHPVVFHRVADGKGFVNQYTSLVHFAGGNSVEVLK